MNNPEPDLAAMLAGMDLDALKELRKKLARAIDSYEKRKRQEALSAMEQIAREHGFKLGDLLGDAAPGQGRKSARPFGRPLKYVNPEDTQQTWGGRGRRPHWVIKALEAGRTLEELAR